MSRTCTAGNQPPGRLAENSGADKEDLLILAKRVPERVRKWVIQRLGVFGALANCDDKTLDKVLGQIGGKGKRKQ